MRKGQILLSSVCCIAVTISCGGGDAPDGDVSGEATPSATVAVEIPDFVIPAPPGAIRVPMHTENQLVLDYPVDDYARIVAFYDEWTGSQEQTFNRVASPEAGPGAMWTSDAGDVGQRSIVVALSEDAAREIIGVLLSAF